MEALRELGAPAGRPREGLQEMARLVRLEWRARADIHALSRENVELRDRLKESEDTADERRLEYGRAIEKGMKLEYEASASWRLMAPVRLLAKLLRRRRSR